MRKNSGTFYSNVRICPFTYPIDGKVEDLDELEAARSGVLNFENSFRYKPKYIRRV